MKSLFTTNDMRELLTNAFASVDEKILLESETDGTQELSLAEYLNIKLYSWKERVAETEPSTSVFQSFVQQINDNVVNATIYGLVEFLSEKAVASPDIDSATVNGRVTLLVPTNKIANLDYFVRKVRNNFMGQPQEVVNADGEKLTAFVTIGCLQTLDDPEQYQFGECLTASFDLAFTYVNEGDTYSDYAMSLSLDGVNYERIKLTSATWQEIFTSNAVPLAERPDLTGFANTAKSGALTLVFFDFKDGVTKELAKRFLRMSAVSINDIATQRGDINDNVWLKVEYDGDVYIYEYVLGQVKKEIVNNDFVSTTLVLRTAALRPNVYDDGE